MKFEINFNSFKDNHYLSDNAEKLNLIVGSFNSSAGDIPTYDIELNTAEDFKNLVTNIEDMIGKTISLIISFNDPCIFIDIE